MSYTYRQDLNWLVTDFTTRVAYVAHAIVVTADGVPIALSDDIPSGFAEQLAAITSGLVALVHGAARILEAGLPTRVLVEMEGGLMLVSRPRPLHVLAGGAGEDLGELAEVDVAA
jgi:predicted regulator of Ras-like GTPase activity (Roadblock/LC7/MglB family)